MSERQSDGHQKGEMNDFVVTNESAIDDNICPGDSKT